MQNYHTSPLTAILAALSTADPQRGMTAVQIATVTGLNLVDVVIPALKGYERSGVIRYVPSPDTEIHVALATVSTIVTCVACGGSGNYLPDVHLPCPTCTGTGKVHMPPMPGPMLSERSITSRSGTP